MRLATLMILTPDIVEARRFYGEVLGFAVVSQTDDFLELAHQGAALHVFKCAEPAPPTEHGATAASVFVFEVGDIDAAMADLRAKGVVFLHDAPAANAFGRYAAFQAPGGLIHEIFQPFA